MFRYSVTSNELEAEATLLEAMQLPRSKTLYGLALSGRSGDKKATQMIAAHIMEQQRETDIPETSRFEVLGIRHYDERYGHVVELSTDLSLPNALRDLFSHATLITDKILRDFHRDFRVASPDAHHFNCRVTGKEKGKLCVEFTDTSRLYAPVPVHFAQLLMNPFSPMDKKGPALVLDQERMERQADLLQDITAINRDDLLMAAFVTSVYMAGRRVDEFRHGLALQPQQAGHEHYLEVARVVNRAGIIGIDDALLVRASAESRALHH